MISDIKTQISQFQLFPINKSNCQTVNSTYRYNNSNRTKNKYECQCRCRQINPFHQQPEEMDVSREGQGEREREDGEQFRCMECELQVERVAQLKKKNVVVQYRSAKLEEEIEQMRKENENLKGKIRELIEEKIKGESNGSHTQSYSYKTVKQDLQAELFQCKILNQLLMHTPTSTSSSSSSSQLQQKLESSLLQTLTLHCQLQQKTRIISNTVLYPIYHYDRRLKHLKEVIGHLCGKLRDECRRLGDCNRGLRQEIGELRAKVRGEIRGLEGKFGVGEFEKMDVEEVGDGVKMWRLEHTQSRNKQKTIPHLIPKSSQLLHQKQKPKQSTQKHHKKAQPQPQQKQKTKQKKPKAPQQKYLRPCCINLNSNSNPNSNPRPII